MEPGSYIRPHRHPDTFELLLPLRGRFILLQFDQQGYVTPRAMLGETCMALEIAATTWHTLFPLDPGSVIFEVKQGAYQSIAEQDYASWAPVEDAGNTQDCLTWYAQAKIDSHYG